MKPLLLSKRLNKVKQSATLKMASATRVLIQKGQPVINFSIGEPHFWVNESIKKAAIQAIEKNKNRYTPVPGTLDLRKKISEKLKRENHLEYSPEMISVATGAKQSLFNALLALLDEGDEVLIPSPYWTSYPEMVQLAGGTPIFVPTLEKDHFKLSPSVLRKALTPKTKAFILNNPCNPTGSVYHLDELRALWEVLKESSAFVISDEIYEHLVFSPHKFTSFASLSQEAFQKRLTVNGFSKSFSMTGWRLGYSAGPKPLIDAMNLIQGQSTSGPNSIAQEAAMAALDLGEDFFQNHQGELCVLKDTLISELQMVPGLTWLEPEGTFYLFLNIANYKNKKTPKGDIISSSEELALYLLEEAFVATVAGSGFGNDDFLRLSFAAPLEEVKKGAQQIAGALNQLLSK